MCHVAVNCLVYPQRLFIVHVAYYTTQVIQAAMSDLEKIMDAIKKTARVSWTTSLQSSSQRSGRVQEKAATSAVWKAREPPTFCKKAHQEQHKFNEKIDEAMERAGKPSWTF